jgi:hypothetical protein
MSEAEDQILNMLSEGKITAEEANTLLSALESDRAAGIIAGDPVLTSQVVSDADQNIPPDMSRFQRFLRIPLVIAAGSLLLSGLGLALMYQAAGQVALIGLLCIWSIFILALLVTLTIFFARRAAWLHVRIQEKNGRRIAISLPLPLRLANWVLTIARYYVPKEQAVYLQTAAVFVDEMRRNPDQEPIIINIDDDDGDKVQVFIG